MTARHTASPLAPGAAAGRGWRLGPEHPDYGYTGAHGYPVLTRDTTPVQAAPRAARVKTGKVGPIMRRRFSLTPEGAAVVTADGPLADSEAGELTRQNGIPPTAAALGPRACAVCSRAITADPRLLAVAPQRTCSLACAEKAEGRAG